MHRVFGHAATVDVDHVTPGIERQCAHTVLHAFAEIDVFDLQNVSISAVLVCPLLSPKLICDIKVKR